MSKILRTIFLKYFIVLSVLAQFKATAQNCQQAPSIDCGTLTANSGLCTSNVFCIGDSVGIQNNGSTGTIDSTYICWGDGTMDWYSGVFSGCKKHRYAFPVDSCVGGNGTLPVNIVFGVKSYCPGLFSLSWILTPVTIKFQPKARFTLNPNPACVYQPVTFTDQSCPNSNTATYLWNFGDGTTSTSPNPPSHIYTIAGQYTVTLSITNSCATSTVIHTITILPPTVVAPIVISPLCAPASFTPDVNSQNATSFLWSFTAGTGSITAPPDSQPLITLPNPGTYGIHLSVTGCCLGPVARCSWDTTLTVYVAPTTSVTHIPDFCGNASFNPLTYFHISGGTVNSYNWSFPGGSPTSSTSATPGNVTYANLGTYIITLVLNTPCGPITMADTFSTLPPTIVQPLVTLPSACAPATIVPDVNSVNATGFTWSLNGGSAGVVSPQDSQPSITLNTSGSFAIHLVAQGCCTAPTSDCVWDTVLNLLQGPSISQTPVPDFCGTASLTPSNYINASGAITTYAWTFPGGSPPTSNVANPGTISYSSPGTYIIHLSVTSPCGPQNVSDTFVISPPTIVQPLVTLPAACSPVTFIPDINSQNATGFNWTLNGGTAGITSPQDSQPSIAINTSGVFAIHLQAQGCCTAPTSDCVWDTSVTILQGPSISQTSIPDFCGSATISPSMYISASGAITTYAWTFVGGSPPSSSSANPGSVSYLIPGTYIVQLNVTSPCGPSSVTDTFKVEAPTVVQPISNIPGICTPLSFVPDVNSQNATGFLWSTLAGNAVITVPTDSQPTFSVTNVGTLIIQVVASGCCIDPQSNCTWDTTVTLTEGPSIVTSAIPLFCDSATVNPANYFTTSGGISSYSWSFPGGTPLSSTSASPGNVNYSSPGVYLITLLLNGPCGTIQKTDSVQIGAPPTIAIVPSTLFGCDSLTISFINTSPGNQTYLWTANGGTFVGGSTSTSNAPFIFFSAPGSYAISVETFSAGCPSIINNFPVNLGEAPHLSVVASTPDVCDTITFIFSNYFQLTPAVSDSGYNWTILFNANIIYSDSSTNPPPFQIGAYGTYIVQSSVWNGCDTILLTDTFTISPPPTLTISSDTSICKGTPALNLFANPAGGTWTWNGTNIGNSFDPNLTDSVNNYLLYSFGSLTCAVQDSFLVQVFGANINAGLDTTVCKNSGLLFFNGNPGGGYWSGNNIIDTILGSYNASSNTSGIDTLVYTLVEQTLGCLIRDTVLVSVVSPTPGSINIPDSACINQSLTFQNNAAGTSAIWDFGDGSTLSSSNFTTHIYTVPGNYTIILYITNQFGCIDTVSRPLEVAEPPNANFVLDTMRGCSVLPVLITDLSNFYSATTYSWDYGNGVLDTIYQPGTILFSQGTEDSTIYHITLTASNGCGVATYEDSITVYPIPVVDFGIIYSDSCSPAIISFANTTTGRPQFFSWYVNGVFISSDSTLAPQIFVTDSLDSTYHVTLISTNFCGTDTLTKDIVIHPNSVVAFFNTDLLFGCRPLNVTFTSFVGPNATIQWNFGDGNFGTGYSISHVYDTAGTFTIVQSVDNYCGFDTVSQTITVLPQPDLSFNVAPINCANLPALITNTSPDIQGSIWDYGDGSPLDSSATSPSHLYPGPGFYTIALIGIANLTGCRDTITNTLEILRVPEASFAILDNDGCIPFTVDLNSTSLYASYYTWTLGNGDTLNDPNQQYVYTQAGAYTISLTAVDTNGCKDDSSYSFINVYPIPVSDFIFTQSPICNLPADIVFTNNSIGAQSYLWDFGSYGNSNVQDPILNFTGEAEFNTQLISINTFGCKDTSYRNIKVYPETIAQFSDQADYYCEDEPIHFVNTSQYADNFYWTFGDGDTSNISDPFHYYINDGTYSIMLVVNNDSVCFDTSYAQNSVLIYPRPISAFTYSTTNVSYVDNSGEYNFLDQSTSAVEWAWNFGDNSSSTVENPIHRFFVNGEMHVELVVVNQFNCPDTSSRVILIEYLGSLFIPNAFSPEGGTEETKYFTPKGVGLKSYLIEVFSPYGERVWYSDRIIDGQAVDKWDGTYNGKQLPQGAYAWKVKAIFQNNQIWEGMKYPFTSKPKPEGTVTLIK